MKTSRGEFFFCFFARSGAFARNPATESGGRTSMRALFSAFKFPSAGRMNPGEGFRSPAAVTTGRSSIRAFFAGACVDGGREEMRRIRRLARRSVSSNVGTPRETREMAGLGRARRGTEETRAGVVERRKGPRTESAGRTEDGSVARALARANAEDARRAE